MEVNCKIPKVNVGEGVKLLATVSFFMYEHAREQVAAGPGLLFATCGRDLESFVNKIRRCITTVRGHTVYLAVAAQT